MSGAGAVPRAARVRFKPRVAAVFGAGYTVYDCFDEYELIDLSAMNEFDRHIEHSELLESTLENRSWNKEIPLYDVVEKKHISKEVRQAINTLLATQRQRFIKYYYHGKSYKKIAEEEGCEYQCVQRLVYRAREKLKRKLNNNCF